MARPGRRDLTFEEALAEVRARAPAPGPERVPLEALAGRVLAEDVRARADHPPFTNSAMDGYALRAADAAAAGAEGIPLAGESRAGAPFAGPLPPGRAIRVSTGAEIPEGADAVLRREDAEEAGGAVRPRSIPAPGAHVRRRGEDMRRGAVLLARGHRIAPHEVAAVAAAGHAGVACLRRLRVTILATGDEVVPPGAALAPGQVWDANRPGVAAQARGAGADVLAALLAPDDREATVGALRGVLEGRGHPAPPDLLVTVGGVSAGRHDHLRPALEAAGVREVLFGVRIRPGHPLWLGTRGEQVVLGLPGNPVSAAVCFHVFGRPLLGRRDSWDREAPLARAYRSGTPRTDLVRCRATPEGALDPLPRQASHAVTSLAGATHLAAIPGEPPELPRGARVRCLPLRSAGPRYPGSCAPE